MISTLPVFEDPFFSYGTTLDGISYVVSFHFNQREAAWYLSLALPDGTELLTGQKILCGVDLLWRRHDDRLPRGVLMAVSTNNNVEHPGLQDFGQGKRVELVYMTEDEL